MLKHKVSHPRINLILVIGQRNNNKKRSKEPVTSVTSLFEHTLVCLYFRVYMKASKMNNSRSQKMMEMT